MGMLSLALLMLMQILFHFHFLLAPPVQARHHAHADIVDEFEPIPVPAVISIQSKSSPFRERWKFLSEQRKMRGTMMRGIQSLKFAHSISIGH